MMRNDELKHRLLVALSKNEKKPADLCKALGIPKSALSQYLSGKSKKMSAERLQDIAEYLNVSEVWLMGYDVPMDFDLSAQTFSMLEDNLKRKGDEEQLLKYFHLLNNNGRFHAINMVKSLSDMPDFREESSESLGQTNTA